MPKDNIERAIKKGQGGDAENYDEIRYEGRGPGGVALIVEALTDNRNRTSADVRSTFSKYGGAMGETGSVAFMFDHVGRDRLSARTRAATTRCWNSRSKSAPTNASRRDEGHEFLTSLDDFIAVRDALEAKLGAPASAGIAWRPQNIVAGERRRRRKPDQADRNARRP